MIWRRQELFRCDHPSSGVCPQIGVCVCYLHRRCDCVKKPLFAGSWSPWRLLFFLFYFHFSPFFGVYSPNTWLACVHRRRGGWKVHAATTYRLRFLFVSRRLETSLLGAFIGRKKRGFVVSHATRTACHGRSARQTIYTILHVRIF